MENNALEIRKNNVMTNESRFDYVFKLSQVFADSDLVPDHFRKKPANVFVALQFAERLGLDPMSALQNIYVVKGRPCLSSQMLIALVNTSGVVDGNIIFIPNGKLPPEMAVTAKAKLKSSGEVVSVTYHFSQAVKMGTSNNGPWQSVPEQMCCYRAATLLIRRYFPELALGLSVKEEIEELTDSEPRNVTPQVASLDSRLVSSVETNEPQETRTPKTTRKPRARNESPTPESQPVAHEVVEAEIFIEPANNSQPETLEAIEPIGEITF
jgi:hypothetical protein